MVKILQIKGAGDFIEVTFEYNDKIKTGFYKSITELMEQYRLKDNPTKQYNYTLGARSNFTSPLDRSLNGFYSWNSGYIYNDTLNKYFNNFDYSKVKQDYTCLKSNYSKLIQAFKNSKK